MTDGNDNTMGTGNTDRTDNTAGLGKTGRTDTHGGTGLETLAAVFEAEDQGDMFRALRPSMRTAIIAGVTVPGAPGTSRFGGHPDLPADVDWPVNADTGAPLSFIGQFNLTELHGPAADAPVSAAAAVLPDTGMLYFFYDVDAFTWGFDPADGASAAILFREDAGTGAGAAVERRKAPEGATVYRAHGVTFGARAELPHPVSSAAAAALDDDTGDYHDLFDDAELEDEMGGHKLLGHSGNVQGAMEKQCALVTGGIYLGSSAGYRDPRAEELAKGTCDWRLLLQVDSADDPEEEEAAEGETGGEMGGEMQESGPAVTAAALTAMTAWSSSGATMAACSSGSANKTWRRGTSGPPGPSCSATEAAASPPLTAPLRDSGENPAADPGSG